MKHFRDHVLFALAAAAVMFLSWAAEVVVLHSLPAPTTHHKSP